MACFHAIAAVALAARATRAERVLDGTAGARSSAAELAALVPSAAYYTVDAVARALDSEGTGGAETTARLVATCALTYGVMEGSCGAELLLLLLLLELPHAPLHASAALASRRRGSGGSDGTVSVASVAAACAAAAFWPAFVACRFVALPALALALLRRTGDDGKTPWSAWAALSALATSCLLASAARRSGDGLAGLVEGGSDDAKLARLGEAAALSAEAVAGRRGAKAAAASRKKPPPPSEQEGGWGEQPPRRDKGDDEARPLMTFKEFLAAERAKETAKKAARRAEKEEEGEGARKRAGYAGARSTRRR